MKKWALPLSLAVALAANSAAALAATDPIATNFRGHFKTQLQYNHADVNKDPDGNLIPEKDRWVTGVFGGVDVDLRGDIVLSPNAQNRFVLELRGRVRGDKFLDMFPTRIDSAPRTGNHIGKFGRGLGSGNIFGSEFWNANDWIDKAYLENKSSWWEGGPVITTRIGRQDPNYNPWVARFWKFDRTGVTVEGFKLGPASIRAGYIWGGNASRVRQVRTWDTIPTSSTLIPGDAAELKKALASNDSKQELYGGIPAADNLQSLVLNVAVPIESAQLDLTGVRTVGTDDAKLNDGVIDYAVGLNVPLTEQLSLSGNYARDGYTEKSAYRVQLGADLGVANLTALYRKVEQGYAPIYEDREDFMNPELRTVSKVHDERTGFKVAANTQVHGWNLSASYDSSYREWLGRKENEKINTLELAAATRFANVDFNAGVSIQKSKEDNYNTLVQEGNRFYIDERENDKNVYTVGLGTNFDIVRATYEFKYTDEEGKDEETDHTIALAAPLKVPYLDTVHVGGSVTLRDGDRKTGYGIDLAWQGKNGLRFGVHYTGGYKLSRKDGYVEITEESTDQYTAEAKRGMVDPDDLRKYVYPDGTVHYLGNGLAVTAGWGIEF